MSDVKAYDDYIMVDEVDRYSESATGLILATDDLSKSILYGLVRSIGANVRDVAVGDTVMTEYFAGSAWGEKIFVRENDVLAIEASP